jgi:hypothetical protein
MSGAVVRQSSNADDLSASGCEIAVADLNETAAIKIAIRGADAFKDRTRVGAAHHFHKKRHGRSDPSPIAHL